MPDAIQFITWLMEQFWPLVSWIMAYKPYLSVLFIVFYAIFQLLLVAAILISLIYFLMIIYILFFKKPAPTEKALDLSKAPFVSIHIPTRNELAAITCAKACLESDYPANKFEVIIGDDSNDSLVSAKLESFAEKYGPKVKVIKREKNIGFKAGNLNNMAKYSKGEFFVIFDSDFIPPKDFLQRIVAPLVFDKSLSAVQARWKPVNAAQGLVSALASSIIYTVHFVVMPFLSRHCNTGVLCGSAEAVRKSDLVKLGMWKSGSLTEDIEYSFRLFRANKRIAYLEKLDCECEVPFRQADLYKQQMRWSFGIISSLKEHLPKAAFSKEIGLKKKAPMVIFSSGYIFTSLILALFITGALSTIANIDVPSYANTLSFFSSFSTNVLLTIGPLVASFLVLYHAKKLGNFFKMLVASFSFGIVTIYFVNLGVYRALTNKSMEWFLVSKKSNKIA